MPNPPAMIDSAHSYLPARPAAVVDRDRIYAAAVESSVHAFITFDLDYTITSWNPGAESMFGYSASHMVGRTIDLIFPDRQDPRVRLFCNRIRNGSLIETYEAVRVAKDGRKLHVAVTLSPIKAPAGAVVGVFAVLSDVTSQKLAELMFATVVESCPSGIIVSDPAGRIVLANSSTERLLGYDRGELLGQPIGILVPERLRDSHAEMCRDFFEHFDGSRKDHGRVIPARCKDGSEIAVEIELNLIMIDGSRMALNVMTDVRERQRVERLKNEFVATVCHELRTPLTSIAGSLGLLLGGVGGPQPDNVVRLLSIAHDNSRRLVRLINDMLDIEKIESGLSDFQLREADIRGLVDQAIDANRGYSEQLGVQIRLDPAAETGTVCVDVDRILQVITNLLSNACKFSPPGRDIEVRIVRNDASLRVSIRDHGPGVPDAFKQRLFAKFAQAHGSSGGHKGGSGLGLNIVMQIVTRHGGSVGHETPADGGAIFFFELPAVDVSNPALPDAGSGGARAEAEVA
jgi:PAS domain S-box-containing protein